MTYQEAEMLLGLDHSAGTDEIRAAYLRKVQAHPPDRDPEMFEQVRDAYEKLKDPRAEAYRALFSNGPDMPLENILPKVEAGRKYAGAARWLEVFRKGG